MFGLEKSAPVQVTRGFAGAYLSGGTTKKGVYQIENLTPNPVDTADVNCRAKVSWSEEKKGWFWGEDSKSAQLEVENCDPTPDLRVAIVEHEGKSQLAVRNGEGQRSTELLFAFGPSAQLAEGVAESLDAFRGDKVVASLKTTEEKSEGRLEVGGQTYLLEDGWLRKA